MKFYELTPEDRRLWLKEQGVELVDVPVDDLHRLDRLSENVVGKLELPVGLIKSLRVNRHDYKVPMVTEEPSVVAAANHGASLFAQCGGVTAVSHREGIYGQIVLKACSDFNVNEFEKAFPNIIAQTNQKFASLVKHGGGVRTIEMNHQSALVFLKVLIDPAEAMGANRANAILEFMAANFVQCAGITTKLFAILSNYPSQLTQAKVRVSAEVLGGHAVAERIALLSKIGQTDPWRAVTNNKGIMNGVDSVLLATGNDTRAVEAACGVWANKSGKYSSLSTWQVDGGDLVGRITLPLAIGTVGGSINARQDVQQNYRILGAGIKSGELAGIIAAVGLANNLAALLAIATTGIQEGHMKLQARNIVAGLNATTAEKAAVVQLMIAQKNYSQSAAQEILEQIREEK